MKRIFFSLLSCGMFAGTFAQIDNLKKDNAGVSDKWVITPVPTMKGVLGRLDINFPADVERNILIYQQTDNQFLRSVSRNDKIYTIAPGQYRFTLTNVPVENVPIQKGHETRIKAGFLDIVSEGDWHLYDETKETAYTSGNKPKKLPLPVGRYQIKLGGQFYPVIIKDGETVEDSSPVEDETPVHEKVPVLETEQWVARPMDKIKSTPTKLPTGRLNLDFGENIEFGIHGLHIYERGGAGFQQNFAASSNIKYLNLPPGFYNIGWQGTDVRFEDVKIIKDYETSVKHGVFSIVTECSWWMGIGTHSKSGTGSHNLAAPAGISIALRTVGGGEQIQYYTTTNDSTVQAKVGYLNVTSSNFSIRDLADHQCLGYSAPRTVTLIPGKYKVYLGGVATIVTIKPGETVTL